MIGGEVRPLRSPGFVGEETAVQEEKRLALPLDLEPSPDAGKFDVRAHSSSPPQSRHEPYIR